MLNQAAGDREILAQHLGISPHQLRFVTRVGEGQGLIFYGRMVMPFVDHFPKDTKMYQIMTTKLLETMPQAEPEETGAESEAVETEKASGEAETDAAETAAVIAEEKPVSKTTAKAASKSTSKSTSKGTLKNASVKKPLSDSAKKKAVKKPAAETEKPKTKQKASESAKPKTAQPKDPDEALLKGVSDLLPRKGMEWSGTATELLEKLGRPDISPNIATRKLNEKAEKLLSDYGISYERIRNHSGRLVKFIRVEARNRRKKVKKKERIAAEIEKTKAKRQELTERIAELERRYKEEETFEMHELLRKAKVTPEELAEILEKSPLTRKNRGGIILCGI